ncbi:MAG: hypothetical protein D6740_08340, partial [Alphaproteobacteria bacterium]
ESGTAQTTDARLLGRPGGGRWLRAGGQQTTVVLPFSPPHDGIYRLSLRATGSLAIGLDGESPTDVSFAPFLERRTLGTFALSRRLHRLTCLLQPRSGVDSLLLQELATDPDAFVNLAGLDIKDPPDASDLDRTLKLLTRYLPPR